MYILIKIDAHMHHGTAEAARVRERERSNYSISSDHVFLVGVLPITPQSFSHNTMKRKGLRTKTH
jgi:hypothetical protein